MKNRDQRDEQSALCAQFFGENTVAAFSYARNDKVPWVTLDDVISIRADKAGQSQNSVNMGTSLGGLLWLEARIAHSADVKTTTTARRACIVVHELAAHFVANLPADRNRRNQIEARAERDIEPIGNLLGQVDDEITELDSSGIGVYKIYAPAGPRQNKQKMNGRLRTGSK